MLSKATGHLFARAKARVINCLRYFFFRARLSLRVENKRLYAFLACIFDENSHRCPTRIRMNQSGCTLFWYTRSEINRRKLYRRSAMRAAISAWQTPEEIPETLL